LALSPDGRVLAARDWPGAVTLIDTNLGSILAKLAPSTDSPTSAANPGPGRPFPALTFSPDGDELAIGDHQGDVDLWGLHRSDARAGSRPVDPILRARLPGHRGAVTALAYDASGRHLACAGSDRTVDVWDITRVREEFTRLGLGW
jgi:WD40 repeat protein